MLPCLRRGVGERGLLISDTLSVLQAKSRCSRGAFQHRSRRTASEGLHLALEGKGLMVHISAAAAAIFIADVKLACDEDLLRAYLLPHIARIIVVLILIRLLPAICLLPC